MYILNLHQAWLVWWRTQYFEYEWTDFDGKWHKWSMGQGHETIKIDLEACCRHHFQRVWATELF